MLPTISALPRAAKCAGSASGILVDHESEYGTVGTWKHVFFRAWLEGGDLESALAKVPAEYRTACERVMVEKLPFQPGTVACEVAVAIRFKRDADDFGPKTEVSVRLLPDVEARQYVVDDDEVPGTMDAVGIQIDEQGRRWAVVPDWKSGYQRVETPADNVQIKAYAYAAARAYDCHGAIAMVVYTPEDEEPRAEWARFGPDELDAIEDDLVEIVEDIRTQRAAEEAGVFRLKTGEHCIDGGFACPRIATCPATTSLISHVASTENLDIGIDCDAALTKLDVLQRLIDAARDEVKAQAAVTPFKRANGKWFGPVRTEREALDGPIAHRVLAAQFGSDVANQAAEMKVTKAGMKDALRMVAPRGKLAELERQALKAIDAEGGIDRKVGVSIREHVRQPQLVGKGEAA